MIFDAFLNQLWPVCRRSVLAWRDGSVRASRKRQSRNETRYVATRTLYRYVATRTPSAPNCKLDMLRLSVGWQFEKATKPQTWYFQPCWYLIYPSSWILDISILVGSWCRLTNTWYVQARSLLIYHSYVKVGLCCVKMLLEFAGNNIDYVVLILVLNIVYFLDICRFTVAYEN